MGGKIGKEAINKKDMTNASQTAEEGSQISGQMISERQKEILDMTKVNPSISREEISQKLNINPSAVQRHIEKLKEKGIIKRVGPDKGGYWEVIDMNKRRKNNNGVKKDE